MDWPDPADVIAREAERLRSLSPEEGCCEFIEVINRGWEFIQGSPHRGEILAEMARQEDAWHQIQWELFRRFGVYATDSPPTPFRWSVTLPER